MTDIEIHRTGRSDQVFLRPRSDTARKWMNETFGKYAELGMRVRMDDQDIREFEQRLRDEGFDFDDV